MNSGWICPKCEAVMSPSQPTCFYCKPREYGKSIDSRLEEKEECQHDWYFSSADFSTKCKLCGILSTRLLPNGGMPSSQYLCQHEWAYRNDHQGMTCSKCNYRKPHEILCMDKFTAGTLK